METQAQFAGLEGPQDAANVLGLANPVRKAERKRCVAWTEEEHRNFLIGMKVLGVGNWKGVSQVYVPTRSAPQIASHAQKYFHRIGDKGKKRARPSLFDLDMEELEKLVVAKKAALDARAKEGHAADATAQPRERTFKDRGREAYPNAAAAAAAAAAPSQAGEALLSEVQAQARIQQLQAQVDRLQAQADRLTQVAAPSAAAPGPSPDLLGLIAHASQVQLQVEEHRRELLKACGGPEQDPALPLPSSPTGHSHSSLLKGQALAPGPRAAPSAASPPAGPSSPCLTDIKGSGRMVEAPRPGSSGADTAPRTTSSGQAAGRSSLVSSSFGLMPVPNTPGAVAALTPLPALTGLSGLPPAQVQQRGNLLQSLSQLQPIMMLANAANDAQVASLRAAGDARLPSKPEAQAPSGPAPLLSAAFPQAQAQAFNPQPTMNLLGFNGMQGFTLGSGGLTFAPGGLNLFNLASAQAGFAPAAPSHGPQYFAAPMGLHAQYPQGGIFLSMAQPQGQAQGMNGQVTQVFL